MGVTYKLKLNGGDIKAVQGDSFYNRKNLNPQIHDTEKRTMMEVPEGVDAELLAKSSQQSGNGCVADIISKINARGT